jgi:hypothetical protein
MESKLCWLAPRNFVSNGLTGFSQIYGGRPHFGAIFHGHDLTWMLTILGADLHHFGSILLVLNPWAGF